jgi:hypothetical protein
VRIVLQLAHPVGDRVVEHGVRLVVRDGGLCGHAPQHVAERRAVLAQRLVPDDGSGPLGEVLVGALHFGVRIDDGSRVGRMLHVYDIGPPSSPSRGSLRWVEGDSTGLRETGLGVQLREAAALVEGIELSRPLAGEFPDNRLDPALLAHVEHRHEIPVGLDGVPGLTV